VGKIAFDRDGEIWSVNPDGTGPTQLTNNTAFEARPAWWADGSKIAFESYRDGNPEIYLMNADGGAQTRLTNIGSNDMEPSSYPSGFLAFSSDRDGNFELYSMSSGGALVTRLTNHATEDLQPAVSANGSTIAFVKGQGTPPGYDIYTMGPGGGATTNITNTPASSESHPNWSPDGTRIAFDSDRDGDLEIYTSKPDGTDVVQLTHDSVDQLQPAWSPDGQQIAFEQGGDILVMNSDGTDPVNVTSDAGFDGSADWQAIVSQAGYVRPKGANPVRTPLVPAFAECTSPNRVHGPPLAYGSCTPTAQLSTYLTVGTPDSNGAQAKSIGSYRFAIHPGAPGPPHDSAFQLDVNITDVRCTGSPSACGSANATAGPDYTGELAGEVQFRITDRDNGQAGATSGVPATMTDYTLRFPVSCAATADTTIGATCHLSVCPDAFIPGLTPEGKRSIWEMDRARIEDGGPDGAAATLDNAPFATQGLFVP
jgi:Tol biopolymer transport system component